MPELPEVETVRRGLAPVMEGALIEKVMLARPDLRFPFARGFASRIEGAHCVSVSRRGKYLIVDLDNGRVIIMHMGMSGCFRIEPFSGQPDRLQPGAFSFPRSPSSVHDHVVFSLQGASGRVNIVYNDPRRFGFMDLVRQEELGANRFIAGLGPDPLGNHFSSATIAEGFAGRSAPLKSALLDQRAIAGLGNIYVCEALWQARLSPYRRAGTLAASSGRPTAGCRRLEAAVRDVLTRAIEAGGSSLRDHRLTDGTLGYFQHSFRVYGRGGEHCLRPGCRGIVERTVQSARSTYWCRTCQK